MNGSVGRHRSQPGRAKTRRRTNGRTVEVYPIEPVQAGLPGARTLIVVQRANLAVEDHEPQLAYYHAIESINSKRNF